VLIVNLKAYGSAAGEEAEKIAEAAGEVAEETGERVVVSPQPQDMFRTPDAETFSQHVDPVEPGSHTGSILAESVAELASGTLLNHSEKRIPVDSIEESIERCKENGLDTVVCAQSPEECGELSELGPDYVAFEPPELIGGDTSVSEAEPELIEKAVELSEVPVLTGAGIKNREDVEKSIELGCVGVLVASGIVKAEKPEEKMKELCEGL
jgi:triosephosphate isomerase